MTTPTPSRLTHIDDAGAARMVDVSAKQVTERFARAEAVVRISGDLERAIRSESLAKGNLVEVCRLAGIQAAKRTDELIPLCHTVPLDAMDVDVTLESGCIRIVASASTHARTGVEMEALVAAATAALAAIDMGKAIDRAMVIESVRILEKRGGRSGAYIAEPSE